MEKKNIADSQKFLFSFDIFDTLITRRCAEPCAIFAIMQHKLRNIEHMPEFIKNKFFTLRTEAEAFARFSQMLINNTAEIKFDDIYKLMQYNYLISDETINTLKKLDPKTANIVGDIPYLAIGSEEKTSKCAPPVPLIKAAADFIFCKRQKSVNEFQYISTARSGYLSRKFQKAVEKFPTLQKFCFDLHYHRRKEIAYLRIMGIKISLKRFLFKTKG